MILTETIEQNASDESDEVSFKLMPRMEPALNSSNITVICTSFRKNLTGYDYYAISLNESWGNFSQLCNLSFSNSTCPLVLPTFTNAVFIKVIVLSIISILSLIGNLATIYSILKNHRKHRGYTAIYTLILHLSVADVLVAIFCMAGDAIWNYNVSWPWGNAACKIFKFAQAFSLYLSTFVLVLIGIDRFIAVRYPMRGLNTHKKCPQSIVFAWILSFILATPQLAVFYVGNGPFEQEFIQCATHKIYTEKWQALLYNGFVTFFMFLLPLVILISTYISTVIFISRSQKMFKSNQSKEGTYDTNSNINRTRLIHRAKMKSLRISIVIVAAFLIWWTPYYIMMIIILANPDSCPDERISNIIFFFGMSNSLVNPLIYGAFHLWPQKRKRDSNKRSGSTLQQQNNMRRSRNTETPLLHQDSNISNNRTVSFRLSGL